MAEFTPIETQEDLDRIIGARLERERAKYADYETLKSTNADLTAKVTAANQQIEELNSKMHSYEIGSVKTKVCTEMGLPLELVGRINGDDEAAIRADAESLSKLFKAQAVPLAGNDPPKPTNPNDTDAALRGMLKDLNF